MKRLAIAAFLVFSFGATSGLDAGSVVPFLFGADGGQEVPPVASSATGGCYAVLDEPASLLNVTCAHDLGDATAAHIHAGSPGMSGPVVFNLGDPSTSPFSASWSGMSAAEIAELLAGNYYVNIHTTTHPSGELRGQLVANESFDFVARPDESQSVPPTGSEAIGDCTIDYDTNFAMLSVDCTHDVVAPTAAHIHIGAVGMSGPIVFNLGDPVSPITFDTIPSPAELAELAASLYYVNIHSGAFPAGEIRGQVITTRLFADGFESGDTSAWSSVLP